MYKIIPFIVFVDPKHNKSTLACAVYASRTNGASFEWGEYIVRRIIMKVTQFSVLRLQFGSMHAQTRTLNPN